MKQFRKQMVWALVVLICGVSLMGMVYIVFNKPEVYNTPGIVVSRPSPVAMPAHPVTNYNQILSRSIPHVSYPPRDEYSHPSVQTTTPYRGLYATSSAQIHHIGGGWNGVYSTTQGSSGSRGVVYSTGNVAMPASTFIAMASTRQVAQPEATEAPQVASMTSSMQKAPGPPTIENPPEDHQLVEHPLGDVLWPMALLGMGYTFFILLRRRKESA